MNKNTPPLTIFLREEFIYNNKFKFIEGRLASVRALSNQTIQFQVLLENGVFYTGLPPHAICFSSEAPKISLSESVMWDNISNEIDIITIDLLRYMPCTVKTTKDRIINGYYRFSIDYVGNNDLSRDPEHWKMMHVIEATSGELLIYPQYRILFKDPGICAKSLSKDEIKHNNVIWKLP